MKKEDGGPAFPRIQKSFAAPVEMPKKYIDQLIPICLDEGGMSLRDWFAGMALQGLLIEERMWNAPEGVELGDHIARNAYDLADAMLKARGE